jgi:hypothetical protein
MLPMGRLELPGLEGSVVSTHLYSQVFDCAVAIGSPKTARWLNATTKAISRTKNGKPNLSTSLRVNKAITIAVMSAATAAQAFAASTPQQLVQALMETARKVDTEGFLSNLSSATRQALKDSEAAQDKLSQAQKTFEHSLDEHFGEGPPLQRHGAPDSEGGLKAVLARLVNLELLGAESKPPDQLELRIKTSSKNFAGRVMTEEGTFMAVKEGDEWKLVLTGIAESARQDAEKRTMALDQVTKQVQDGAFKDRISALTALLKLERGQAGEAPK